MKPQVGLSNWSKVVVSTHRKSKLKSTLKQILEMTKIQSVKASMSLKDNDMTRPVLGMN